MPIGMNDYNLRLHRQLVASVQRIMLVKTYIVTAECVHLLSNMYVSSDLLFKLLIDVIAG